MDRLNNVKLCRSCLSAIFNGFIIFETLYQFKMPPLQLQTEVRISEIFEQLVGINLNENDVNLPKYLCLTCLERLFSAFEFFELCKISDVELKTDKNVVGKNVKLAKFVDHVSSKDDISDSDNLLIKDNDDGDPHNDNNEDDSEPDFEYHRQLNISLEEDENISKPTKQIDKIFDCLKCNKMFSSSAELKRHERVHEGDWSCTECDKMLSTKHTFRHHMMLHMGKPFECTVCTWRFARIAELNRHTKMYHLRGKYYECDECSNRFYTKSHLTLHKLSHLNSKRKEAVENEIIDQRGNNLNENDCSSRLTNKITTPNNGETESKSTIQTIELREFRKFDFNTSVPNKTLEIDVNTENTSRIDTISKHYRCKKCFKKFRHRNNYLRHLKMISNCLADLNCRTNPQKCQYCMVIADNVTELRKHLELHLDQDPFRCKICNKNYKSWLKLAEHTRLHLMKKKYHNNRNHLCTICGRGLPSAKLLEEHYFVHQGIRNYKCEYCDRAFYTKSGIKQHSAIHTRDVLQCSECGKILADKVSLRNHLTIHYGKKFKCSICEKLFPNVSALNRHVKVHRGERNFQCDQCSKRYMARGHLNDHIRKVHENPRTMACEECGIEFTHRGSLNKHRRLEHAEKPVFKCNECGKCFGRKSRLADHYKKFHPENYDIKEVEVDNI